MIRLSSTTTWYDLSISAICGAILAHLDMSRGGSAHVSNADKKSSLIAFTRGQCRSMPDFLRIPFYLLMMFFVFVGWVRYRKPVWACSLLEQQLYLNSWRHSRIGFFRDFVRVFDSLIVFAYYGFGADRILVNIG